MDLIASRAEGIEEDLEGADGGRSGGSGRSSFSAFEQRALQNHLRGALGRFPVTGVYEVPGVGASIGH